jgi:putative acetyltransferase
MPVIIRNITVEDNAALATLIRASLDEFDIPRIGTVYSDPETDYLYEAFQTPGSTYFIAEEDGVLIGGCGIFPTAGLPGDCAELVKYYLSGASRGKGLGKLLMDKSIEAAKDLGYKQVYLESFPNFSKAVSIYEKAGFKSLDHAMGNSGHVACTIWMLKEL